MFGSADIPPERLEMVETYNMPIDCMWVITVKESWKVSEHSPKLFNSFRSIVITFNVGAVSALYGSRYFHLPLSVSEIASVYQREGN